MERQIPKNVRQIGNVSDSPKMYMPWLNTMANRAAKNSSIRSCGFTSSRFVKREAIQKQSAAPTMRKVASDKAVISVLMTSFPMGDISPQAVLAISMQICPV